MSTLYSYDALNMFRKMKPFCCYGNKNKNTTPATLCSILNLAENDALSHKNEGDQIKITVLPPTNATGNITYKESGDENGSGTINNLTGSMLVASAKLDHKRSTTTEDNNEPAKKKPKQKAKKPKRNWVNTNLASDQAPWIPANAQNKQIYFPEKSKAYGYQEQHKLLFRNIDIKWVRFNAKCRLMWENAFDTRHELVANAMRWDKFKAILTKFQFATTIVWMTRSNFQKLDLL